MPIPPIPPLDATTHPAATAAPATPSTGGADFANILAGTVDDLQSLQSNANTLAVKAVTGNLDDISQATVAAARAQVTTELVAAVRSQAVDGFNEIMRMQA